MPKKKQKSNRPQSPPKKLPIGQTMETADKFLPNNKKTSLQLKESRPVIIVNKLTNSQGIEEYEIVPASTKKTRNTRKYNKHGIKYIRNNLEIMDNEQNQFLLTKSLK